MTGVLASFTGYQRRYLRSDLVAGLTVWAVLVPEALAYATIAGVSPVIGRYAALGALLLYAVFGSSRHLVVGPMAATAALSAAAVGQAAGGDTSAFAALTVTLALVTGVLAVLAGVLRLGFIANFISEPVLKGFIVGLALTIIVGQVPKLPGVPKGSGNFFEQLWHLLTHLLLDLDENGVAIVGPIAGGLPALGLPEVPATDNFSLVGPAVGVMLVGFAEPTRTASAKWSPTPLPPRMSGR